jgi:hypothetical protein
MCCNIPKHKSWCNSKHILIHFNIIKTSYSAKLILLDLEMFLELIENFTCYKFSYYT